MKFFTEADCDPQCYKPYISLAKANQLYDEWLSKAKVVTAVIEKDKDIFWSDISADNDTHRALLINIEPLEKDSAESLLKEFADFFNKVESNSKLEKLLDRAKRLLKGQSDE